MDLVAGGGAIFHDKANNTHSFNGTVKCFKCETVLARTASKCHLLPVCYYSRICLLEQVKVVAMPVAHSP